MLLNEYFESISFAQEMYALSDFLIMVFCHG